MNHKIQLLAIAPYEALKHVILETAKEFPPAPGYGGSRHHL